MAAKKRTEKQPPKRPVRWGLWLGLAFLGSVLLMLVSASWKLAVVLQDAEALPIETVALKGARQYTQDVEVRDALQDLMLSSFFTADVAQVQQTLTDLPWVYRATVRREWPRQLKVHLIEQVPLARWNEAAWLNDRGEVFEAPKRPGLEQLPDLRGPDEQSKMVLQTYQQLQQLLGQNGFTTTSLALTSRQAWKLQLARGIELRLGRSDKIDRVQRFIDVFTILEKRESKPIAYVDLRYDTGLAVGLVETDTENR
ncbi:cell division protein FtsQ/DivIB [Paraferrimonas haliotis]|uniref:Cell division protein FtsQ n=1 Tax=Paraferrimonas haliotis TaxID=2013866 RepID=A0AA37TPD1_9GAMM|nr:cell division protein FtsQ/DivIB [Paraferrimonas haliotis]GLS82201.1 cell division protein FtsQ [Paraferrimonas haliotis]